MPNRMWIGNPGCVPTPCCGGGPDPDPEDSCGKICITVRNEHGATMEGASVNGGSLGTQLTDSSGRTCFDIDEVGEYGFTISMDGYDDSSTTVDIGEVDCDPDNETEEEVIVDEENTGGCTLIVTVNGCGCDLNGALVVVQGMPINGSWVRSGITAPPNASITFNVPGPCTTNTILQHNITVSKSLFETLTISNSVSRTNTANLFSIENHFCNGGTPPICLEQVPESVFVTFGSDAAWFGNLAGQTIECIHQPDLQEAIWYACVDVNNSSYMGSGFVGIEVHSGSYSSCTQTPGFVTLQTGRTGCGSGTFTAKTTAANTGTGHCPVSFTGKTSSGSNRDILVTE